MGALGVSGISVDVMWGIVEARPLVYNWQPYRQLFNLLCDEGFTVQVTGLGCSRVGGDARFLQPQASPWHYNRHHPQQTWAARRNRDCPIP
jgi:hypothetical protein